MLKKIGLTSVAALTMLACVAAPALANYGAIAVGNSPDGQSVYSYMTYNSNVSGEAEAEAESDCRVADGTLTDSCQVVLTWEDGCAYVAIGFDYSSNNGVWGTGATAAQALSMCREDGAECKYEKVIGGCNTGDDGF